MPGSVRVVLEPISHSSRGDLHVVAGATLSLTRRGPGKSKATTSAQPASLIFTLALLKGVRPPEERENQPLATLNGKLVLESPGLTPSFTISDGPPIDDRPNGDEDRTPADPGGIQTNVGRTLLLKFDPSTFFGPSELELKLPVVAPDVRHLEILVELQVGGAVESAADVNDVLDKPVGRTFLRLFPGLCLDTPRDDPAEHNLVLRASLHGEALAIEKLTIAGQELVEGEHFFQDGEVVFFRPAAKPSEGDPGLLVSKDGREFKFELHVAKTARERLDSLVAQVKNAAQMADSSFAVAQANGKDPDAAGAARFDILAQSRHQMIALLASIEGMIDNERDFGLYYARIAALPALHGRAVEDVET